MSGPRMVFAAASLVLMFVAAFNDVPFSHFVLGGVSAILWGVAFFRVSAE